MVEIFVITENPEEAEVLLRTVAHENSGEPEDKKDTKLLRNFVERGLFEKGALKNYVKNRIG